MPRRHPAPDAWTLYPQIATTRRLTVHFNPPSSCILEISVRGVKICVRAEEAQEAQVWPTTQVPLALPAQCLLHRLAMATVSPLLPPQGNKCSHFFQLKNISFCGYHPKNNK